MLILGRTVCSCVYVESIVFERFLVCRLLLRSVVGASGVLDGVVEVVGLDDHLLQDVAHLVFVVHQRLQLAGFGLQLRLHRAELELVDFGLLRDLGQVEDGRTCISE